MTQITRRVGSSGDGALRSTTTPLSLSVVEAKELIAENMAIDTPYRVAAPPMNAFLKKLATVPDVTVADLIEGC